MNKIMSDIETIKKKILVDVLSPMKICHINNFKIGGCVIYKKYYAIILDDLANNEFLLQRTDSTYIIADGNLFTELVSTEEFIKVEQTRRSKHRKIMGQKDVFPLHRPV